jgi:hypothetical protein
MRFPIITLVVLFASSSSLRAETVYYQTATGENFQNQTWHSMERREFKAKQPENVYDSYTIERLGDGSSSLRRQVDSKAGDWLLLLTYLYAPDGRLRKVDLEFRTFSGIDVENDDEGMTRCLRSYAVERSGKLRVVSERIEDFDTHRLVKRSFYMPDISHWKTLKELPIQPKT